MTTGKRPLIVLFFLSNGDLCVGLPLYFTDVTSFPDLFIYVVRITYQSEGPPLRSREMGQKGKILGDWTVPWLVSKETDNCPYLCMFRGDRVCVSFVSYLLSFLSFGLGVLLLEL